MRTSLFRLLAASIAVCSALTACTAADEQPRSPVPATLGWNSWNQYGCGVTEAGVRSQADALVSSGLAAAGYRTVIVDDCWMDVDRDADGRLRADPATFPSGMRALGDYLHARGLRFGLYESPGTRTCTQLQGVRRGTTGSAGHEITDARTFADWGVDYLKYDWCGAGPGRDGQLAAFRVMADAIGLTGRPIVLAINPNSGVAGAPPGASGAWGSVADAVRVTNDVLPTWTLGLGPSENQGVGDVLASVPPSPGTVRDLDMLVAGLPGLTATEGRTQIIMWAMLGSPLILGTDIGTLSPNLLALLKDPTITTLATDRTSAATRSSDGTWHRALPNGGRATARVDPNTHDTRFAVS